MHITILALGSTGDVLPLAVLGGGLRSAGYQVLLATYHNFQEMADQYRLDFHPIHGNGKELMMSPGGLTVAGAGRNLFKLWAGVRKSFGAFSSQYAKDLTPLVAVDTDLIINQLPGGIYGLDLAEKQQIPMILAAVIPLTRTRSWPMLAFPSQLSFFPGYNACTYVFAEQLVWTAFRPVINRWRQKVLNLPEQPFWGHFQALGTDRYPVLNGFSSWVVPRPPDWGDAIHTTGYWLPETPAWQAPVDLIRFLADGSPPVYIGFGSMPLSDPHKMIKLIVAAINQTGLRAVLHSGWAGLQRRELPESLFLIDYAPYDWLFPQMAAVVHHGGSGTTAFGLRSGVPSLVIPFVFDQYFWGRRISKLGVGPEPIPSKKLTVQNLSQALMRMITDQSMGQKAAQLGEKLHLEDGIQQAVDVIKERIHR